MTKSDVNARMRVHHFRRMEAAPNSKSEGSAATKRYVFQARSMLLPMAGQVETGKQCGSKFQSQIDHKQSVWAGRLQ